MKLMYSLAILTIFLPLTSFAQRAWENDNSPELQSNLYGGGSSQDYGMDYAQRYNQSLQQNMIKGGRCDHLVAQMDRIAEGVSIPSEIRIRQIDRIFDSADRAGCIIY